MVSFVVISVTLHVDKRLVDRLHHQIPKDESINQKHQVL